MHFILKEVHDINIYGIDDIGEIDQTRRRFDSAQLHQRIIWKKQEQYLQYHCYYGVQLSIQQYILKSCDSLMGLKLGDRLIVLKTKRDIQLSYDCECAKLIIANNADYTPASSYALAAQQIAELELRFGGSGLGTERLPH